MVIVRKGGCALVVAWLLVSLSSTAQAHPQLAGAWVSPSPPGGFMTYHFCLGEHLGNGVWRGNFILNVSHVSILKGVYELRMFDDHQGTLGEMSSATNIQPAVGVVDFNTRTFILMNTTYRKGTANPIPAGPDLPAPRKDPKPIPPPPMP